MRRSYKVSLSICICGGCIFGSMNARGQETPSEHKQIEQLVDGNSSQYKLVSKQIWDFAELGYHENKSSKLLQDQLKQAGFSVQVGVADEPTGFIASYGQGKAGHCNSR
jgi:aminobenzoyl-glutamate utilization protein B